MWLRVSETLDNKPQTLLATVSRQLEEVLEQLGDQKAGNPNSKSRKPCARGRGTRGDTNLLM